MVHIGQRILDNLGRTLMVAPINGFLGALGGYIYAKFADLPSTSTAQAYAVWSVADVALINLVTAFSENRSIQFSLQASMILGSTAVGILELKKRGLIGKNLEIFIISARVFVVLDLFNK